VTTPADTLALADHHRRAGDLARAEELYRQALAADPTLAEGHSRLGICLAAQGRLAEAEGCFRRAVALRPDYAAAHNNLGKILLDQGRPADALAAFDEAVRLRPDYVTAHHNRGVTLEQLRQPAEAEAAYEAALRHRPDYADALVNLGGVQRELGRFGEARTCLDRALSLRPEDVPTRVNLGLLDRDEGRTALASAHFRHALAKEPDTRVRILEATLLPPVYESRDDLHEWRARLTGNLRRLRAAKLRLDVTRELAPPLFYLPYQGQNDRDVQRDYAELFAPPPDPPRPPRPAGRIRVGFASAHFHDHTVGRLNLGTVAHLDRSDFEVTVLSSGRHDDATARAFREHADRFVELPADLPAARQAVAGLVLDVLIYTELGMDWFIYTLAFSRLAPVQCVTWGHPVTSGLPTIDYFLSSDPLEPDGVDDHYSERLVRLKRLAVCYPRPQSSTKGRTSLGLPESGHVYACPQSLFKFHPEFDAVLAEILRRDPAGVLMLLEGWSPHWTELLLRRFSVTLPDVVDRVRFLPKLSRDDFLALCAAADVLLDPLHFGGGNTTYEALAVGTPVVTLPSGFLRGRITLALYRQMNVTDCVAASPEEYVERAVQLGTDREFRAAVRTKIAAAADELFDDTTGVRELEDFLRKATAGSDTPGH
jgi:protein O-GlcNAc transferase